MSTLSVRLPESLHKAIKELAQREGISINQFIATSAAEKVIPSNRSTLCIAVAIGAGAHAVVYGWRRRFN